MGQDENEKKSKRRKKTKRGTVHPSDSEASRDEVNTDGHINQSFTIEEEVGGSGDSPAGSMLALLKTPKSARGKAAATKATAIVKFIGKGVDAGGKKAAKTGGSAAKNGLKSVLAAKKGAKQFMRLQKRHAVEQRSSRTSVKYNRTASTITGLDDSESVNSSQYNKELISYFAKLARSDDPNVQIDLEFIEDLLDCGANINCTDRFGQNILHEVARTWEVKVAEFLIEKGIDVNQGDVYGRTPLHVAAAVDFPDMIKLLLETGADIECLTKDEEQTPLHFAARNDACEALKFLVKREANIHSRDYKNRTPLQVAAELEEMDITKDEQQTLPSTLLPGMMHMITMKYVIKHEANIHSRYYKNRTPQVAAELDRSETAKLLLQLGADASDSDNAGQTALVLMIIKMPAVAKLALDQFHRTDRANRLQYYDINFIEPTKPDDPDPLSKTALAMIVQFNQLELVMHPVIQRLIDIKWRKFGKFGICKQLILNVVFILVWTAFVLTMNNDLRTNYLTLAIGIVAVLLTMSQIYLELVEFFRSKNKFKRWQEWRTAEVEKDMKFCHPRWPQEERYLMQEIGGIEDQSPSYFSEFWNYFDWFIYISLMIIIVIQFTNVLIENPTLGRFIQNTAAIVIIFVWLRSLKVMRGFRALGPFIVMLGLIAKDIAIFGFLYFEFFIPYAFAFWVTFGGGKGEVTSMATVDQLMYSLFRLTLVDEYQYDEMRQVDVVMTYILCSTFLFLSAILCINLFIALLSNTFQRIYDNATSNAVMQQASIILNIEDGISKKKRKKMRHYIHHMCSPEALFYDDDVTREDGEELKLMTFQIKESLEEMQQEILQLKMSSDVDAMREELRVLKTEIAEDRENLRNDVSSIKDLLQTLLTVQAKGGSNLGLGSLGEDDRGSPSVMDHDYEDPYELKTPENKPRPRFVGRRDSKMDVSLFGEEEQKPRHPYVDSAASAISLSNAPVVQITDQRTTTMTEDREKRLKQLRLESKARRKLRKEQEDYLQQQLTRPDRGPAVTPHHSVTSTAHVSDSESDSLSVDGGLEDTQVDNLAAKVRMHHPAKDETTFAKTQP